MTVQRSAARERVALPSPRAGRVAWGIWGMSVALAVAAAVIASAAFAAPVFGGASIAAVGLVFATVGAVLGSRRPGNPVGWLFAAWGLVMNLSAFGTAYALPGDSGLLPGAEWVAWAVAVIWHPAFALLTFILLLFPHGWLPSPRWRPFAYLTVASYAVLAVAAAFNPYTVELYFPGISRPSRLPASEAAAEVFNALLGAQLLLVATAMVAMVLKLHRSRGRERQQLKWFVYAVVVAVTAFIGGIVVLGAGHLFPVFALIPVTAGYAIMRHHLYDIDRVISRTVTYALLTALLAGVYSGAVLLFAQVLPGSSDLAVAISTLLVAAVFQPARRRIQKAVNRRFNRQGYDAERTIDAFSTRLRDQLDLDALESALVVVVSKTMEPAALSLWLRTPEGRR
jgi:hypothetical protein